MKASVCLFAALVSACSFAVELPALPQSEFADTEVSTNFSFAVCVGSNRWLVFLLELQASPSNSPARTSHSPLSLWSAAGGCIALFAALCYNAA